MSEGTAGAAGGARLTRRRLIGAAAGAAAGAALDFAGGAAPKGRRGGAAPMAWPASSGGHVAVVGAGLAGLTAAYELDRSGWDVTVLEAGDRVGGRVHTLREPFEGGQHAEAGGEYIDTVHRRLREYASRFGLRLEDTRRGWAGLEDVIYRRGRRRAWGGAVGWRDRREMNRFWRRLDQLARPLDPHDPVARGADLDRRSVGDLFDDLGLSGLARFLLEIEIRDDYGVEADRLSLLYAAQADRLYWNVYDRQEEVFRIRGGNGRLVEAFARRLGDSVRLSAPVTAVTQLAGGVRVSAGGGEIEADYCVLAAPLPALRAIHFSPALGSPLREAVAELQYGAVTKNVLQYRQRFWRQRGVSGDAYTDLALRETWEATDQQDGRRGILIAYAAGDRSARFEREAADERLGEMARQVGRIWPGSERLAGERASVAWVAEPYSGGAWTAYAPGQVTAFWEALRRSYGRLYLAGEHTSDYTGYMEGAIRSGRRAAALIAERGA